MLRLDHAAVELQALLDAAVDAIILIDHRGIMQEYNRAAERLFGYTAAETLGRNVSMLMTERDRDQHDAYMQRYIRTGVPHVIGVGREVVARRKDGSEVPCFLSVGRISGADPPRFVGFVQDTTLRQQALAAVQRERDRANRYLEAAQTILLALDRHARVTMINRKGCEVLGCEERALLGEQWFERVAPDEERARLREQFEALMGAERAPHYFEYRVRDRAGALHLIAWRCVVLDDGRGAGAGLLCSGDDVTESRRAEQDVRQARQRMMHVSRLATVGEMASGVSHELNQPLAAIANFAQAGVRLLAAPRPDLTEVREALEQITVQSLRAGEIIRRLRSLVRRRETQRERTDINALIEELGTLIRADARASDTRVAIDLAPNLPELELDRVQIQQVVLNLLRNAIDALEEVAAGTREITIRTAAGPDASVELAVADSGPGVAESMRHQLFSPFATTKPSGTGLGLAISRSIVEAHRGRLEYRPNVPHGAMFVIRLPIAEMN